MQTAVMQPKHVWTGVERVHVTADRQESSSVVATPGSMQYVKYGVHCRFEGAVPTDLNRQFTYKTMCGLKITGQVGSRRLLYIG